MIGVYGSFYFSFLNKVSFPGILQCNKQQGKSFSYVVSRQVEVVELD